MANNGCVYAVVRFFSCARTEEFLNVGVVMYSASCGRLVYDLVDQLPYPVSLQCAQLYAESRAREIKECARLQKAFSSGGVERRLRDQMFKGLIEPTESVIRYSEMKAIVSTDLCQSLESLVESYIGRLLG